MSATTFGRGATPATARAAAWTPRQPGRRRRQNLAALGLIWPWLIGFGIFFVYPLVSTVWFSFTHYDQINPPTWVGLRNWRYVFGLHAFWQSLGNTAWLVVVMVSLRVVSGLGLGLLVVRVKRGAGLLRTVFYLPYLAPPVAATIAFAFLLNPGTGPVNTLLSKVGIQGPDWFNDPAWAKPALTLLAVWGVGDLMVIFVASLLDVPAEQYEAAELDGAGPLQRFRYITIPHLRPVLTFAAITGVIATLQYYTQAVVVAQVASGRADQPGAPFDAGYPNGSTLTLPQLVYSMGFQHFETGSACVISVVLFVIAMAFTSVLLRRGAGFIAAED
ncbi:carbohydrate ABC transporter permease [Pedococcus bigeumensis]|uniref:Sugar ABC transporter permease n=1 Tax=Pedococcus bigeumensis TaxID=433644 RepID=A0A502CTK5_9MICO|nr:sugar ABC transporter permease [Pedococcus bigeumensis]TPG15061.1 sugar ABC transporter permease [Pedococcus bigeumensis]